MIAGYDLNTRILNYALRYHAAHGRPPGTLAVATRFGLTMLTTAKVLAVVVKRADWPGAR